MDNFAQILCRLPTISDASTSSGHSGSTPPFKVQVNFNIPVFEGQIDADALEKWLNMLEGYFLVYNFSDREKITFALLKVVPHVKIWWETHCEKTSTVEPSIFPPYPPGNLLWMLLRSNITLSEAMMINTRDGPHYDRKGTKQCRSSPMSSTPFAPSWVSKTLSGIWL